MSELTANQIKHLLNLMMNEKKTPREHLTGLFKTGLIADLLDSRFSPDQVDRTEFRRILGGGFSCNVVEQVFCGLVDYDLTMKKMIVAGEYDRVSSDITSERFPHNQSCGTVEVNVKLVGPFNCWMSNDNIDCELEIYGLRDAKLPELLALGAKHKDEQRKGPIVARGSVWRHDRGGRLVTCLDDRAWGRDLGSVCLGNGWDGHYRFAAVRKT